MTRVPRIGDGPILTIIRRDKDSGQNKSSDEEPSLDILYERNFAPSVNEPRTKHQYPSREFPSYATKIPCSCLEQGIHAYRLDMSCDQAAPAARKGANPVRF